MLKTHVAYVYFKCLRCFRGMLQLFHTDITKVDRDVAYIAMVVHVCCKRLFPMFHLCFWTYCYKRVYLNVAYVSHICCKCFSCVFVNVLEACFQVFHLDVSEVDRVLHILKYA